MTSSRLRTAILAAMAATFLTSCALLDRDREEREAAEAADREGRIEMVLNDAALEVDPDLAATPVDLPEVVALASWGQAGGQSSKAVGHVAGGEAFDIAWRRDAGAGSNSRSALTTPPVTNESAIFTIDSNQRVTAFNIASGNRLWSKTLKSGRRRDGTSIGSGIAVEDEALIVASGFGFVTMLDASTGDEVWRVDTDAPMTGSPTIKDNRVFVSSNNNEVFALDLETGDVLWTDQAIAEPARVLSSPSPAAVEDIVVAPYSSGEIIAYLANNGRRLWDEALTSPGQFTPISAINDIGARPVLAGGLVFAASQSGIMAAIDGRTGTRVWQQPIGSIQAPAIVGQYLFIVSVDAQLVCINAGTGQVFWVTDLRAHKDQKKKKGRITYSGPIVASGKIVLASSRGDLLAFDPQTGEEIDRLKLGDPVYIEPIAVQDKLLLLTDDAKLIAVR
ncbi:MAG: PQQ-binding-like beta-propeller repeat protein [Pseudomonadota bacterium]